MQLGPLPGSWSLTARGPYQPSRRVFYRIPADLLIRDEFFRDYGGDIETIRTGHRYSWAWPAVHVKGGKVIGPVLWYDVNHNVVPLPHVDDLPELPAAWVQRGYELMNARAEREQSGPLGAGTAIAARHADAIIAKQVGRFMEPNCRGGDFRSVLFGLSASCTRRALARGHGETEIREELRELFATHPWRGTPNDKDAQWIADGITAGRAEPWEFSIEVFNPDGTLTDEVIATIWETYPSGCSAGDAGFRDDLLSGGRQTVEPVATDDELSTWVSTYVSHHAPGRLRKRVEWMRSGHLAKHARALVHDVIAGHYPARQAVIELHRAYRARGGTDPKAVSNLLAAALGAVLNPKVGAR
jgi:hypothetical protein